MAVYIEREAICYQLEKQESIDGQPRAIRRARRIVADFPAADVVPVRHGRWIKDGEDGPVYCSECGEEHEWEDYRASYCDTCGAKMDGSEEVR